MVINGVLGIEAALIFFIIPIYIFVYLSQIFVLCLVFEGLINHLNVMVLS